MDKEQRRADDLTIDGDMFCVLVNEEGQHSIWPAAKPVPQGWSPVGPVGTKAECLAYIEVTWIDMRPQSLRDVMGHDRT